MNYKIIAIGFILTLPKLTYAGQIDCNLYYDMLDTRYADHLDTTVMTMERYKEIESNCQALFDPSRPRGQRYRNGGTITVNYDTPTIRYINNQPTFSNTKKASSNNESHQSGSDQIVKRTKPKKKTDTRCITNASDGVHAYLESHGKYTIKILNSCQATINAPNFYCGKTISTTFPACTTTNVHCPANNYKTGKMRGTWHGEKGARC